MVDPNLILPEYQKITLLLSAYWDIFDASHRPVGQTTSITHRIDPGADLPVHQLQYCSSNQGKGNSKLGQQNTRQKHSSAFRQFVVLPCCPWASERRYMALLC